MYLFEGDSCYPISPCEEMAQLEDDGKGVYSSEDQIARILQKYGKLDTIDRNFLDCKSKTDYLDYFEEFVENNAGAEKVALLKDEYKDFPKNIKELLFGLLEFNPSKRLSTEQAIKLRVFDAVRLKSLEQIAHEKISLDVDQAGTFDYTTGEDLVNVGKSELRKMILDEVSRFKQNQYKKNINLKAMHGGD